MTVEAIKDAIVHLSEPEREELADWFDQIQEDAWDREMERDFSPGGRGEHLAGEIDRQIETGNFSSLEDGLRKRRERRSQTP
jgi:Arc/MetJ-type ribon-helix-helix transcriptional regulator